MVVSNMFFMFTPYLGKMNPFRLIFFQMGWFNHQPETHFPAPIFHFHEYGRKSHIEVYSKVEASIDEWHMDVLYVYITIVPRKLTWPAGTSPFLIWDTSSNGFFAIVILVLRGCTFCGSRIFRWRQRKVWDNMSWQSKGAPPMPASKIRP